MQVTIGSFQPIAGALLRIRIAPEPDLAALGDDREATDPTTWDKLLAELPPLDRSILDRFQFNPEILKYLSVNDCPHAELLLRDSGPRVISGLPLERLQVSVERGEWFRKHEVLASEVVDLRERRKATVALQLRAPEAPIRVPLAGTLHLPETWGEVEESLVCFV